MGWGGNGKNERGGWLVNKGKGAGKGFFFLDQWSEAVGATGGISSCTEARCEQVSCGFFFF